jgi:pimeloyl-ACP methyl ester carboxylesterase
MAAVAGYVSLLRPDIPYPSLEARYASPASRFMDLPGGVRLHYRDQGDPKGPVLLMVHGFAANLDAWEPWVQRLKTKYRLVTLDLPGHGLTRAPAGYAPTIDGYADLVEEVRLRMGLGQVVLIGNSMGGAVAWDGALRHPGAVRALVLVDAAGWPKETAKGGGTLIFRLLSSKIGQRLIRDIDTRALAKDGLVSAYVDPALVTPALVDRYVLLSRAPGHRDILLGVLSMHPAGVTVETLKRLKVPTLVMHGEIDKLVPHADGVSFSKTIPGARLISYPGVGHVPMEQIPDRSAADLDAFLAALSQPGR